MIIKLRFAGAAAGAAAVNGGPTQNVPTGPATSFSEKGLNISVFRPANEEPSLPKMSNVIDSGIRKTSEFFPEAA